MEITTTTTDQTPRRKAATGALAMVGFITLILIGIALAIYAARYVPLALNRLGTAAVSLSSVFTPAEEDEPALEVVTVPAETVFEPIATSTATTSVVATAPVTTGTPAAPTTPARQPVPTTPRTVTVPVTVPPPAPHGLADLAVDITATGYCSSTNPDSFRAAREVPDSEYGGFKFAVRNAGTNNSGRWDLAVELPTTPAVKKTYAGQRTLGPGDRMEFTLCFTEPRSGTNRDLIVRVDSGRDVNESNENNNSDTAQIDIER
ncbi:MAG TPA: CARDB domain-containing protein [Candidatus Paceibacterota bacterium]|jgi:hypothetical protein